VLFIVNNSSFRTLPLYPIVRTVLLDELEKQNDKRQKYKNQYEKNSFVCVDEVGNWLQLENVTTRFPCVLRINGLKVIRYHDLRHSCATILYNKNIQQRDLKDWLGHSDIQTTNRYTHTNYANKIPLAESLNSVMPEIRIA
jgi:Site-specific recombinase XerD